MEKTSGPPTLPATSVAVSGNALPPGERVRRAVEDATFVVDDLRGAVRWRVLALRIVAVVGAVIFGATTGLNPVVMFFGSLWSALVWLPVHVVWGMVLRARVMARCDEAGLAPGPVYRALQIAARHPRRASRSALAEATAPHALVRKR